MFRMLWPFLKMTKSCWGCCILCWGCCILSQKWPKVVVAAVYYNEAVVAFLENDQKLLRLLYPMLRLLWPFSKMTKSCWGCCILCWGCCGFSRNRRKSFFSWWGCCIFSQKGENRLSAVEAVVAFLKKEKIVLQSLPWVCLYVQFPRVNRFAVFTLGMILSTVP
jgi:hypothetical protein